MESMTKRLDALSFTASHSARTALAPAAVPGHFCLPYGRTTGANYFSNGAQKYQMWGFMPEAPQAAIGVSLAESAQSVLAVQPRGGTTGRGRFETPCRRRLEAFLGC